MEHEELDKLMCLLVKRVKPDFVPDHNRHWVSINKESPDWRTNIRAICLVCDQTFGKPRNIYEHALIHLKEHGLLIFL